MSETNSSDAAARVTPRSGSSMVSSRAQPTQNLADILERVLDKGIVIVGDIQIKLLDIELLTIKVRLLVASVERAREMGINWWEGDPFISSKDPAVEGAAAPEAIGLQRRVEALEQRIANPDGEHRPAPDEATQR